MDSWIDAVEFSVDAVHGPWKCCRLGDQKKEMDHG